MFGDVSNRPDNELWPQDTDLTFRSDAAASPLIQTRLDTYIPFKTQDTHYLSRNKMEINSLAGFQLFDEFNT